MAVGVVPLTQQAGLNAPETTFYPVPNHLTAG